MEINDDKSIDRKVSRAVCKAFEQLFHDLENAPTLIFEVEEQAEENEQTINEITSWLFEGRHEDGYSDNNVRN